MPEKASSPATGITSDQWPAEAADFVVRTVETVRDKTTGPVIKVVRGAVFGLLAAFMGLLAFVLFAIALVRVITVYLPGNKVWYADLIVGGLFTVAGIALWTQTRARD